VAAGGTKAREEPRPQQTGRVAVVAAVGADAIIYISYTFYRLHY